MHYSTLTLTRFLQNLRFLAENGMKNAYTLQKLLQNLHLSVKGNSKKKSFLTYYSEKFMRAMNDTISIFSTLAFRNKRILSLSKK